jgi:hypothetical protein
MIIRVSGTVGQWGGASGPGNLGWAARFRSSLFLVIFFNNYDHYYEEDGDDMVGTLGRYTFWIIVST